MKKLAMMIVTACMLLSVGTAAYAADPATETMHEKKMHEKKVHEKKMHAESKKMHMKKLHSEKLKMKAKGTGHKLHAKGLKAKATEMPKTGFGGASEQME
ncbi:hypothetical protein [Paenibacillus nasutitermitis]|uniref:Pentapeptide MXKDX repeat protein n=1 Tax=Paenibacillus nasutitermitis TaxID=1652958 RepID=A0A916Z4B6_9BACL|nr:hypothetical protein [Paenibacillus nasutitermitis]GGD75467.1 hypothetical protein GCM10010911_36770 [Paenibacillus nasutitermitis]